MTLGLLFLVLTALLLAYSNGSNDNFKGVATLYGSNVLSFRNALGLATLATFSGSLSAIFLASNLIANFSGKGLVPDDIAGASEFLTAVSIGAGITVLAASRFGIPISTTHALVGALLGAGMMSSESVNYTALGSSFVLPLLLSPFMAFILSIGIYWTLNRMRKHLQLSKESCFCIGAPRQYVPVRLLVPAVTGDSISQESAGARFLVSDFSTCSSVYTGTFIGISLQKILDVGHIFSAAAVSFARGLNDTPKIAGILVAINTLDIRYGMVALALAMGVGGLLNARRVAETISRKIVSIEHGQGFAANLATSVMVVFASRFGVPVSTTHVSVGSIFGIGTLTNKVDLGVMRTIVLSWVATLPIAAFISALVYQALN